MLQSYPGDRADARLTGNRRVILTVANRRTKAVGPQGTDYRESVQFHHSRTNCHSICKCIKFRGRFVLLDNAMQSNRTDMHVNLISLTGCMC